MRLIRALFVALFVSAGMAPATAETASPPPPDPALLALPMKQATALIANDAATLRANCAASATVVDEFAPYAWSGPDACVKWAAAFKAFATQYKMANFKAAVVGTPFTDVSGTHAYMTARMSFHATMAGKPIPEEGTWTFVLTKAGGSWKITQQDWGVLHH